MVKKKGLFQNIILIVFLLVVPIAVMAIMGFDHYDANEFLIISVAVLADILVYITFKLIIPRLSS